MQAQKAIKTFLKCRRCQSFPIRMVRNSSSAELSYVFLGHEPINRFRQRTQCDRGGEEMSSQAGSEVMGSAQLGIFHSDFYIVHIEQLCNFFCASLERESRRQPPQGDFFELFQGIADLLDPKKRSVCHEDSSCL